MGAVSGRLKFILGGAAGCGMMWGWWTHHTAALTVVSPARADWLTWAVGALFASLVLQWVRTGLLFRAVPAWSIAAPVGLSHGINVLAPSLLGDVFEVVALSRMLNQPAGAVLTRLLFRFCTTLAALGVLAAIAVGSVDLSAGFALASVAAVTPFVVDAWTPRWSARLPGAMAASTAPMAGVGWLATAIHTALAILQHTLSAASIFILGAAIDDPVSPPLAAGMLSLADIATYLPVPLGGIGLHHWSVSSVADLMGTVPTGLVLVNHALIVLVGGACAVGGWLALPDKSLLNRQNV